MAIEYLTFRTIQRCRLLNLLVDLTVNRRLLSRKELEGLFSAVCLRCRCHDNAIKSVVCPAEQQISCGQPRLLRLLFQLLQQCCAVFSGQAAADGCQKAIVCAAVSLGDLFPRDLVDGVHTHWDNVVLDFELAELPDLGIRQQERIELVFVELWRVLEVAGVEDVMVVGQGPTDSRS